MEMMTRTGSVVTVPHALVADGRAVCIAAFLHRETLGAYVLRNGIELPPGPVAVWHNGRRVPDALWTRLIPRTGDQIVIRARATGGGGNKVLRTVAMIAVAIVAAYTGGAAASAYAGATGTAAGSGAAAAVGAAASAAVMVAGSLLVNALIPIPRPSASQRASQSESSLNSIQAARNGARLWEPMMLVMGTRRVVPDLASQAVIASEGDDQYLSQIFHFGLQPDLLIADLRLGDTPLANLQGVEIQQSGWDGVITLAPDNVDTIAGFDLRAADGWSYRTTPRDTNHIELELQAALYHINTTTGENEDRSVSVQLQYRDVTLNEWHTVGSYVDPIYATHYWALGIYQDVPEGPDHSTFRWVQSQYGSLVAGDHINGQQYQVCQNVGPGGDYGSWQSCQTYEWRWLPHPHSLGRPWQGVAPDPLIGYQTVDAIRLTGRSPQKPQRVTVRFDVPQGQYELRMIKLDGDVNSNTDGNSTTVMQIRAYQNTPTDYRNQCRLAVRIRSTAQTQSVDELSGIAVGQCYRWDGASWSYGPSSNPAWWFYWFALGRRDSDGNRLYGMCLSADQIDVDAIKAWGLWCVEHDWTWDYVVSANTSAHDMLTMIARAGRASYTWQTGRLGVVWDAADVPVTAMVGPFNIRAGTFEIAYADGDVDMIVGNFINNERGWENDQVRAVVPGAPSVNNPLSVDLDGTIWPGMAQRAVNLLAASQQFHRRRVSWEMDIEGMIMARGDVVQVSHDLTVWGYAGRLLGGDRGTLRLDRRVPVSGPGWLLLRGPENQMVMLQVSGDGEIDELAILNPDLLASFPIPGDAGYDDVVPMDWAWQFDPLQTPGRRLKIVSVSPAGDEGVRLEAVDDDPGYYLSERNPGQYTPPRDGALLSGVVLSVGFAEDIRSVPSDDIGVRVSWVATTPQVRVTYAVNGVAGPPLTVSERYVVLAAHTGDVVSVTVTPINGRLTGASQSASTTVQGLLARLPLLTGLTSVFRDGLTVLVWQPVDDIRRPRYEVRRGETWDNAETVAVTANLEALATGDGLYFVAARYDVAGAVVYGPADTLAVSGAVLVRNLLVTAHEHPAWAGALGGSAFVFDGELTIAATGDVLAAADLVSVNDVLWYGGAGQQGTYQAATANVVDVGYAAPCRVDFDVDAYALNFAENVLGIEDILTQMDLLNASNRQFYSVRPQVRTAQAPGVWGPWRDYTPGLLNARLFDARLVLESRDPLVIPFVRAFTWSVDVPDLVQRGEAVSVAAVGVRVTFTKPFHAPPNIQITQLDALNGDRFVLSNVDETGFNIRFFNSTAAKAATMNYLAQGY